MTSHNLNPAGSCFRGAGLFVRAWPRWLLTTATVFHLRSVVARSQAYLALRVYCERNWCAGICLLSLVLVLRSCWSVHGGLGFWSSFEDHRQCSEMAKGLYFSPPSPKFSESEITEYMHKAGGPRLILSVCDIASVLGAMLTFSLEIYAKSGAREGREPTKRGGPIRLGGCM
ncbi:hypothetical protein IW262DRAFT_1406743 [Armillaria fumosa]|nr:hypothetical protein IW262DRAFT_1406743 [Armillaria fumosa]